MSKEYTADTIPRIDIGVAFDPEKKLYQIQLYASNIETTDTVVAVLPPQSLERVLYILQDITRRGYTPTGDGTQTPGVVLPSEAEKMMDKWR